MHWAGEGPGRLRISWHVLERARIRRKRPRGTRRRRGTALAQTTRVDAQAGAPGRTFSRNAAAHARARRPAGHRKDAGFCPLGAVYAPGTKSVSRTRREGHFVPPTGHVTPIGHARRGAADARAHTPCPAGQLKPKCRVRMQVPWRQHVSAAVWHVKDVHRRRTQVPALADLPPCPGNPQRRALADTGSPRNALLRRSLFRQARPRQRDRRRPRPTAARRGAQRRPAHFAKRSCTGRRAIAVARHRHAQKHDV